MKKIIALITMLSLVSCSFFTVTYAEENLGDDLENTPMLTSEPLATNPKPLDYNNELYFEDFDGDTALDGATTQKFGKASVAVKSGDSELTTEVESGEYLEIMPSASGGDLTYGLHYGDARSPVGSKYPASEIDKLAKMQVSFDLCPVSIDKTVSVSFREKLSTTSVKMKNLMFINTNGTFSFEGTSKKYTYSEGVWVSVDFYFDFSATTPVYSVYINDEAVFENAQLPTLDKCVEAFIFYIGSLNAGEDYTFYLDNTRIAIPKEFEVAKAIPSKNSENINVLDPVKIELSNDPVNFNESLVTVLANGSPVTNYTASESDGMIAVEFTPNMEFYTDYTVTLDKSIKDIYGQTLAEDYVLEFKTMTSQIVASSPVFSTNVTTKVVNPSTDDINPALVVSVKNADGTMTFHKGTKTIIAGGSDTIPLTYDISSLQAGQVATAFVVDGISSMKPLNDVFVQKDGQYSSVGSSAVTADVTKVEILEHTVTVEGKISASEEQAVIVKISDEGGNTILAIPVKTGEDGSINCTYSVSNLSPGKHSVSLTGYYVSASTSKDYIYLSDTAKDGIRDEINGAASTDDISTVLATYKSVMTLEEKYYCENVYNTLLEQAPFAEYADVIDMIKKADTLLIELNAADWSKYSKLFADNSEILLKNANPEKIEKYNNYSANKKNEINKIIVESSPFESFISFRNAFNSASLPTGGSGGGGGGGNRTPESPSEPSQSLEVDTSTSTEAQKDTTGLFIDMTNAKWAEESVKELYNKGIVSAAENYRPMDNITREEFVKMLVQLAGLSLSEKNPTFSDVKGNEWYAPYLGAAQAAGIIKGSDNGNFGVGSFITRQDMVVMAQRTVEFMNKTLKYKNQAVQFTDTEQISDYAVEAVSVMQRAGVINGMGNGNFEPQGLANRAQSAVIICNLINSMK